MKIRVGITGQSGFIGKHLSYYLQRKTDEIELIPFTRDCFQDSKKLATFVAQCDCIVHLAAMNRGEADEIYECNVNLVKSLIAALESQNHSAHIIFSSSTQEDRDNVYGASKKEGSRLFREWSKRNNAKFTALLIPNVFGAFGVPFYNSVVSTFCHQLTRNLKPEIKVDATLKLIYVNDLAAYIYKIIRFENDTPPEMQPVVERKVSDILIRLNEFRSNYLEQHIVPELKDNCDASLFNTFRSYVDYDHFPVALELHSDERGWLFEVIKTQIGGQAFYSMTRPGITRGNHYHTRKFERFCVVQGEAIIRLRRIDTNEITEYRVNGDTPGFIDMPIYHTHNITNVGENDLLTLFWSNEIFNPDDPDTYAREV